MRGANKWFVALSTALALAAVSSQTVAQDSAARAARDAAIHKCINQAHREVPGGESQDMQRSEAYKACMVSAGFSRKAKIIFDVMASKRGADIASALKHKIHTA